MKKEERKQLHSKTLKELQDLQQSLHEEFVRCTLQLKAGKLEKPHQIYILRKDIARVKTILGEKSLLEAQTVAQETEAEEKTK